MSEITTGGRPASELSDEELEAQGKQLHDSRNHVFLHGTAAQFDNHTKRMLELEQEYLRRHPKRTWQGYAEAVDPGAPAEPPADPVVELLRRVAAAEGGRLHKLEVHQIARELGIERGELAQLYTAKQPDLATEQQDRVITDVGRARISNIR